MTCLWRRSCLFHLFLLVCCAKCLDVLEPLDYGYDENTQNTFDLNAELRRTNVSEVREGFKSRNFVSVLKHSGLLNRHVELRKKRSCELPESAFIFKQAMVPENDVKTSTTVCRDSDTMSLLKFQGKKDNFIWQNGLRENERSEVSVDNNGMVFKEAIGFEVPESRDKGRTQSKRNWLPEEIEHSAKSRLAYDRKSNGATISLREILSRAQKVEKIRGRVRRQILHRQFRATSKQRSEISQARSPTNKGNGNKNQPRETPAKSSRSWQEKLWENIRRSSVAHQEQRPPSSSSSPWKFLHIKSRSATTNDPVTGHGMNLKLYLVKHRSAESQSRANHPDQKHCKLAGRPHKGHYCHYHYKNHRHREMQAFRRLKDNTKQYFCTTRILGDSKRASDDDAIMSTLGMDLTEPTQVVTTTPKMLVTRKVLTHFQPVQTVATKPSTSQTCSTGNTSTEVCAETNEASTESSTSSPARQTETATSEATKATTNTNSMTGAEFCTGTKITEANDSESTARVPTESDTTKNYLHKKRSRKT